MSTWSILVAVVGVGVVIEEKRREEKMQVVLACGAHLSGALQATCDSAPNRIDPIRNSKLCRDHPGF